MSVRLWIAAVSLLFAAGGCAPPAGLVTNTGGPAGAAPTGIVHVATESDADGSTAPRHGAGSVTRGSTAIDPAEPGPVPPAAGAPRPATPDGGLPVPFPLRPLDCRRIRCVALTFDDGPGPYTGTLLDVLARYQARATFFVLGRMVTKDHEGSLRRMVAEGHELGNHTWDHRDLVGLPEAEVSRQLRRTQEVVRHVTGVEMTLMRPPYGSTDTRVTAVSRHEGLAQVLWNVDTADWRDRKASIVTERAVDIEPGSIVLMHDIYPSTILAVPRLLNELVAKGYTFVTLSELYGGPLTGGPVRSLDIPGEAMARLKALDSPAHGHRGHS